MSWLDDALNAAALEFFGVGEDEAAPQMPAMVTSGSEGEIAPASIGVAEVAKQCPVDTPAVAAPSSPSAALGGEEIK